MAFTGVAAIVMVSDRKARITGLSLAAAATGTISLFEGAGAVKLPEGLEWNRYRNAFGVEVELDSSIEVRATKAEAGLSTTEAVAIVKTGDGPADFLATLSNPDAAASGALEIWVEFH